ncbi:MAG: glycosyltransferase [Bacteroidota bacterium]
MIAPLDWGLGHASRCIPVIEELLSQGADILIGTSGRSLQLLRCHFPNLKYAEFPAYDVRYSHKPSQIPIILRQVPRLLSVIRKEHRLTENLINKYQIQKIISDNRYGVWSRDVPSAFMCHQMAPMLPRVLGLIQPLIYKMHLYTMRHFDEIWIPDSGKEDHLSGDLAHRFELPKKAQFIGPLSRFSSHVRERNEYSFPELNRQSPDIAVVLSGPEPQRSILEEMIFQQAKDIDRSIWIVGGKTETKSCSRDGHIWKISFMDTDDLSLLFQQSKVIISRSGYSSLMDYQALGLKQVILIPTPGQTEQEILGKVLAQKGIAYVADQKRFQLREALERVGEKQGFSEGTSNHFFQDQLGGFLGR